jgi:hypothetical protein
MMDHRPTSEERAAIGKAHWQRFKDLYERTGQVQNHPQVKRFQFIKGSDLLPFRLFPPFPEILPKLVPYGEIRGDRIFLSHRWLTPIHPDPLGYQLALLRDRIDPEALYWVDFSCLPQKPRTDREETLFRDSMFMLPSLMFNMDFLILRCDGDGYFERAWCFFELMTAHVLGKRVNYLYDTPSLGSRVHAEERRVLEGVFLHNRLPDGLGFTDPADMDAIEQAAKTTMTFSLLNLVSHYMALGQSISGNAFFFLENRYYFMATCDFSRMLLWVFAEFRKLGLSLVDLSRDEFNENVFIRMAQRERFRHSTDIFRLPPELIPDQARLDWLVANRHRDDSPACLFYLLSSMIRPLAASGESRPGRAPLSTGPLEAVSIEDRMSFQKWGHPDRLSIELDCPPGGPRPSEVFDLAIVRTDLTPDDFEDSGPLGFGRREFLVKPAPESLRRYLKARPIIKDRLKKCHEAGMIRAATS